MDIDFICREIAEMFSSPCNYSPMDEVMLGSGKCESDCGKISDADCWKRYFKIRAEMESE